MNVIHYIIEYKSQHPTGTLDLTINVSDYDQFIIDFWQTIMHKQRIVKMIDLMRQLTKNMLQAKNRDEINKCYYRMRERLNSKEIRSAKQWVRAAHYMSVLRFCFGNMPSYNMQGEFVSSAGPKTRSCFDSVINENNVMDVHRMLTDKRFHERIGLKLTINFECNDVSKSIESVHGVCKNGHIIMYCDPPYTDTASVYGKTDKITRIMDESIDTLMEHCKNKQIKQPIIMISNNSTYKNKHCKHSFKIHVKSTHNHRHMMRTEIFVSNRAVGTKRSYTIG
jgi:site-specific DNA-adenine methylase